MENEQPVRRVTKGYVTCPICQKIWESPNKVGRRRCPECSEATRNVRLMRRFPARILTLGTSDD